MSLVNNDDFITMIGQEFVIKWMFVGVSCEKVHVHVTVFAMGSVYPIITIIPLPTVADIDTTDDNIFV